jgi:hypothetical protein
MVEMLTGEAVVEVSSPLEACHVQISPEPVALPDEVERSPLVEVLRRATAKPLDQRYGSAREMYDALEGIAAGQSAEPSGSSMSVTELGEAPTLADVSQSELPEISGELEVPDTGQSDCGRDGSPDAPMSAVELALRQRSSRSRSATPSRGAVVAMAVLALAAMATALVFAYLWWRGGQDESWPLHKTSRTSPKELPSIPSHRSEVTAKRLGDVIPSTWDGRAPLSCIEDNHMTVRGVTATLFPGPVIFASGYCHLTLVDSTLTAPTVIHAAGSAQIVIQGGRIEGRPRAMDLSGRAQVVVQGTEVIGAVHRAGEASISGL